MKLSEFIEKYGDKKIDETELSKIIIEEEKYFIPKLGEKYWFATSWGNVDTTTNGGTYADNSIIKTQKVFRTEVEAEYVRDRNQHLLQMERDFLDNSDVIDWENDHQKKFKFYYHGIHKGIFITSTFVVNDGTPYTTNEEWIREYIKDNEENIKKYYFEIEEKNK